MRSFFGLTLSEEYLVFVLVCVNFLFFRQFVRARHSFQNAILLTLGFVMVLKCFVANEKSGCCRTLS